MILFKIIKKYKLIKRLKEVRTQAFLLYLKYSVHEHRSMFCEGVTDATRLEMFVIDRALKRIKEL